MGRRRSRQNPKRKRARTPERLQTSANVSAAAPGARPPSARTPRTMSGRLMRRATVLSVGVATLLVVVKFGAFLITDSVALLSTFIDSLLDVGASLINLLAVRQSLTPADDEHRFGHGKAEPLAGLAQAAFIAGSVFFLLFEAGHRLLAPQAVVRPEIGVAIMLVSTLFTVGLVQYQRHVVRATGSVAISADSLHYVGDVLMNLSVVLSLLIGVYWPWPYTDPLFAIAITGYVLHSAWGIVRQALDQLMDREMPAADRERIRRIAIAHPGVRDLHDLRTRGSGHLTFIQFHLEMAPEISLLRAHQISDEVEAAIKQIYPMTEILIHEDPAGLSENRSD